MGGRWVPLLPPEHPGLSEVKWCMNRFRPFLVIDPVSDDNPGSRDLEEVSIEVSRPGVLGLRCARVRVSMWTVVRTQEWFVACRHA